MTAGGALGIYPSVWLLDHLGTAPVHALEGGVEVLGAEEDPAVGSLRHHLEDGAALVVGDSGIGGQRR